MHHDCYHFSFLANKQTDTWTFKCPSAERLHQSPPSLRPGSSGQTVCDKKATTVRQTQHPNIKSGKDDLLCAHLNFGFSSGFPWSEHRRGQRQTERQSRQRHERGASANSCWLIRTHVDKPKSYVSTLLRAAGCFTPPAHCCNVRVSFNYSNTFHQQWPDRCAAPSASKHTQQPHPTTHTLHLWKRFKLN